MLLEIRHVTQYHYDQPVRESVMELWMQPHKSAQRLLSFEIDINPAAKLFSYADPFGNAVYYFDIPQPHESLTIVAKAAVETLARDPLPEKLDIGEWDRLKSDFVQGEGFDFLRPHRFVQETEALHAFIERQGWGALRFQDPLSAIKAINSGIAKAFDYMPGLTEADSPIDIALKAGKGVCQDFAHIMIAICRSLGIPARYVSGYLFTDRKAGDRSDPDATHAWVEVFLPSLRWVGFDPTNNALAGERHVPVAYGRDYHDVPPTRGVYKGEAESKLAVGVQVRKATAAKAEPEFMRLARPNFTGGRRKNEADVYKAELMQQQQQQQQQQ